jgi:1-phosphofructokinase family hexose kinase
MIVTVTANTALDHIYFIPKLEPNRTIRATRSLQSIAGKGTDASWVLAELGLPSLALGFAADLTGKRIESMLRERGVMTDFVWVEGESRRNIVLVAEDGAQSTVTASTLKVTAEHVDALRQRYKQALDGASCVVIAGTLPDGVEPSLYSELIRLGRERALPIIFDAAEPFLSAGLTAQPTYIKPNRHELEGFAGHPLDSLEAIYATGKALQAQYGVSPIISLGAEGGLAILPERAYSIPAIPAQVVSAAGAGDAVLAGLAAAIEQGQSVEDGLRLGFACATAVLLHAGTAECRRADIEQFVQQIELIPYPW